jgi:hypothetical protein
MSTYFIMKIMSSSPPDPAQNPRWTRHLSTLLLAWVLAATWGSVVQTQWNLQALVGVGVDIPAAERARTTWQDLIGFGPVYAGILAAGWLPALSVAAWLGRRWPAWRGPLLAAAAGIGMVAAVRTIDAVAPMPVFIDATRHLPGLLVMAAGAALAGWLYARLTARR